MYYCIQSARIALETVPQPDVVWYDDMTTMVDFFDLVLSGFDPKHATEGDTNVTQETE